MQLDYKKITPEDVLKFDKPLQYFICPFEANIYDITFLSFSIRDYNSGQVFYEMSQTLEQAKENLQQIIEYNGDLDMLRDLKYQFHPDFFKIQQVATNIVFSVGDQELKNFRMIERHYFKDKLLTSFDFNFPFCIPNSTNTWENIYDLPNFSPDEINNFIENPNETKSDTFYFVNDEIVIHYRCQYRYDLK